MSGHWLHRAACRGTVDPDLFFPEGTTGPAQDQTDEAKAVCRPCEVRLECLAWAVKTGERIGVWGGLDPAERAALSGGTGDRP